LIFATLFFLEGGLFFIDYIEIALDDVLFLIVVAN